MINPPYAPSYECGCQLIAEGCPIDYLQSLPRNLAPFRKTLTIRQLGGYAESRILALNPNQTAYLIALRLQTDLSRGVVISHWSFRPPWGDHFISWDYDARDILPPDERVRYESIFGSRLSAVLNGRLLVRGRPVEGLLCGCTYESIPESLPSDATVSANFAATDDTGHSFALRVVLSVDRSAVRTANARATRRKGNLFDKPDPFGRETEMSEELWMPSRRRRVAGSIG